MDDMNFKRFKEVYPVYRDMGAMCDKAYNQAKELDLFNTREIESLKEQIEAHKLKELSKDITIKTQQGEIDRYKKLLNLARIYTKRVKDVGITMFRCDLNEILGEGDK